MRAWLLVVVMVVVGCGGGSSGPKATGGSCTGAADSAKSCQGMVCLSLLANAQSRSGICSKSCQSEEECGGTGYVCVDLTGAGTSGYCLRTCQTVRECSDGFACVPLDDPSDPISICFVEQGPPGTGGTGGGADCQAKSCVITTDPGMVTGYCAGTPSAKKLCDCPSLDVPKTCTPTNPAAANLYCCP